MKNQLLIFFAIFCIANISHAQVFTRKADFFEPRDRAFSFVINNKLITGTGVDSNFVMNNQVWQYDFSTELWSQNNDFPTVPVRNCISMVINDTAYAGLGWDGVNSIGWYQYNAGSDTWILKNSICNAGQYSGTFTLNGKGYAVCGSGGVGEHNELWEYNPATDAWLQKADFPGVPRDFPFGHTIGDYAYAGLGDFFLGPPFFSDMYRYDAVSDTWTTIAPIPNSSTGAFAEGGCSFSATYNDKLILWSITGIATFDLADYNTIYVYDPITDSWILYENANPVGVRTVPIKGQNGSKAYYGGGDDIINGVRRDFWEIDFAALFTGLNEQNPGLSDIKVYTAQHKIYFTIPEEVLDRNLSMDIYSMDGKLIATYYLDDLKEIDASNLILGNYIYLVKSDIRNLKAGKLFFN